MHRTFRLRKYYLHAGLWPGMLFLALLVACIVASFVQGPLAACLLMAAFWCVLLSMSLYVIAAYLRERLEVDGPRLRKQGVFSARELQLDSSANLQWRCWPVRGSVVARSPLGRVAIDLDNYEKDERVELIDHLRQAIPPVQQFGWEAFCQRWALPLVEAESPPDENTVLETRGRIDKLFLWMLIPTALVMALIIYLDGWKWWPSIFVLAPLWLVLRLMTPKQGMRAQKTSAMPGMNWWMVCFSTVIAGFLLLRWFQPLSILCFVVSAVALVQFFRCVNAEDRRRRELLSQQAQSADARWRALRSTSGKDGNGHRGHRFFGDELEH